MKKTYILILFTLIFSCCANSQQYGVDVLKLDNFDFSLNIEEFYRDESIFRGRNDNFYVSTSEHRIDEDGEQLSYIQYSTMTMSRNRPLASYGDLKFESLCILTDEADENVLMAIGITSYAKPTDIPVIMNELRAEYGDEPEQEIGYDGVNFIYKTGERVANLYVNVEMRRNWDNEDNRMNKDKYAELEAQLAEKEEISCSLFVTTMPVHKAMIAMSSSSGALTDYK